MTVHVHLLPSLFEPEQLSGSVAVMIDVLRASSTVTTALANGATTVRPFADVDVCRRDAATRAALTGGERGGVPLPGFDFGNSPTAYSRDNVAGREICFTTTNGTQALTRMTLAETVLIGSFMNRKALVDRLRQDGRDVHLVCAGTDGAMTAEDTLFAGAVASDLLGKVDENEPLGTQLAASLFAQHGANSDSLQSAVRAGQGGKNLIRLGLEADIDVVLDQNCLDVVPQRVGDSITLT